MHLFIIHYMQITLILTSSRYSLMFAKFIFIKLVLKYSYIEGWSCDFGKGFESYYKQG